MSFQPVSQGFLAEVRCSYDGQNMENTLGFRGPSVFSDATLQVLADAIEQWFVLEVLPLCSNSLTYREVYVRDLQAALFLDTSADSATGTNGGIVSDALPPSSTKTMVFASGTSGRSSRGGNRLMGIPKTGVLLGQVTPAHATNLLAAYNQMGEYLDGTGFSHAIISRVTNKAPREAGITILVTQYRFANLFIGTARSRIPKA